MIEYRSGRLFEQPDLDVVLVDLHRLFRGEREAYESWDASVRLLLHQNLISPGEVVGVELSTRRPYLAVFTELSDPVSGHARLVFMADALRDTVWWCVAHGYKSLGIPELGCDDGLEWSDVKWVLNTVLDAVLTPYQDLRVVVVQNTGSVVE